MLQTVTLEAVILRVIGLQVLMKIEQKCIQYIWYTICTGCLNKHGNHETNWKPFSISDSGQNT